MLYMLILTLVLVVVIIKQMIEIRDLKTHLEREKSLTALAKEVSEYYYEKYCDLKNNDGET